MQSKPPSPFQRNYQDFRVVLAETIQRDGDRILLDLLKARSRRSEHTVKSLPLVKALTRQVRGLYSRIRERGGVASLSREGLGTLSMVTREQVQQAGEWPRLLRSQLTKARVSFKRSASLIDQANRAVTTALATTTHVGGMVLGFQLPAIDIKLSSRKPGGNSIILHSAPLFSVEVMLDWTRAILNAARLHPQLSPEDLRRLTGVETVLSELARGVEKGAAARLKAGSRDPSAEPAADEEVLVSLDEQMFSAAGRFFHWLSDRSTRQDD